MSDALFIGIDGGATNCRARLVDGAGRLLGEGKAGGANPIWGLERAMAEVVKAATSALEAAGLGAPALGRARAGLGLAGVGQEEDRAKVAAWPLPFAAVAIETDAHAACLGAHGGTDGAILTLGTGSCGVVITGGRSRQIGGWGFPISDFASGAWLGLEAVRAGLLGHDRIAPATAFTEAVMARFDSQPAHAVGWMQTAGSRDYAAFAPLVLEHGAAGDPVATALLRRAGSDAGAMLATLRAFGARRLALMGGLAPLLTPWIEPAALGGLTEPEGDALDGAILMAKALKPAI